MERIMNNMNEYNLMNSNNSFLQTGLPPAGSVFNTNLLIADKYSKEYVNEIKKVFKKEKEFLEYKNKTLQYSLNKIKLEFSDQINNLTKQLEDNQNSNILNITTLKNNYESKILELNESHDNQIKELTQNINQLENGMEEIKQNYNNDINEKEGKLNELKNENDRLINELQGKNEELAKIKNSFESCCPYPENFFSY